jgi:hypothetical protein
MGYRSEVACVFVFTDELTRDAFHITSLQWYRATLGGLKDQSVDGSGFLTAEAIEEEVGWLSDMLTPRTTNDMPVLLLHAEDVKWYDSFQVVKHVEKMKEDCVARMGMYKYIRIGEESDDVHEEGESHDNFPDDVYGDDFLRLTRNIYIES